MVLTYTTLAILWQHHHQDDQDPLGFHSVGHHCLLQTLKLTCECLVSTHRPLPE